MPCCLRLAIIPSSLRIRLPSALQVVVKTSQLKGAGTDANVDVTLYGSTGSSPPTRLENSKNNFEKGAIDIFEMDASIGNLEFIRIGHDNTSLGPAWHLNVSTLRTYLSYKYPF